MTFPNINCTEVILVDGTRLQPAKGEEIIRVELTYGENCGLGTVTTAVKHTGDKEYKAHELLIPVTSVLFFVRKR